MWLVNTALRHPYTVWVGMLLVLALGWLGYTRTPSDILPNLKVPVVVVFSSYRGMPPQDMEQSVTAILERALTRCDHLHHIESRSLLGISIIQVYFRPTTTGESASAQVISLVNGEMQNLPPGMLPPNIFNYDASAIPVGNLVISSRSRDDKFLLDLADTRLRDALAGIEGLSSAPVFGGLFRQVQIYVQPRILETLGLSPMDVARIVNSQSAVLPTGEVRIGAANYPVRTNAMVPEPKDFGNIPLYNDGRKIVRLKDVAEIVDGTRWRTNVVRVDGRKAVYMPLLRQAGASAVDVVDKVQAFLPELKERGDIPEDVDLEVAFDQSIYVRDALSNLRYEAFVGAILAALVVLLFLGTLRTTWIVALSIPLSLLTAFVGLYFAGETLNIMTLGGLALVLGRLVDDSVVDVENTVRHIAMGKTPFQAALDSANEISIPVLMATITTVIVFLPLIFMRGMGKYLFTPMAISVALALFASYIVSRTVSPLLCANFLKPHDPDAHTRKRLGLPLWLILVLLVLASLGTGAYLALRWTSLDLGPVALRSRISLIRSARGLTFVGVAAGVLLLGVFLYTIAPAFDRWFEKFTKAYQRILLLALQFRVPVLLGVLALGVPAFFAFQRTGQELFPDVDSSEFTLHMRATGGPRVEETERQVEQIENLIRGYKATGPELAREYARAVLLGEDELLTAIGHANPGEADYLQRLEAAARAKKKAEGVGALHRRAERDDKGLRQLGAEAKDRTFLVPGIVPPEDMDLMLSNVGISSRWSAVYTSNNGPHAAFIRVQLRSGFAGRSTPTLAYVDALRDRLRHRYPTHDFFFQTGGMIRQILNSGAVAPIEVQVAGRDHEERRQITRMLHREITQLASVHDAHSPQSIDLPQLTINVDRTRAAAPGLTETDVVRNVITALMSSAQIAPNFWLDPRTGNPYLIGVQYPEYAVRSIRTLEEIPITAGRVGKDAYGAARDSGSASPRGSKGGPMVRLQDVATIERGMAPVEVYHYKAKRVSQLFVAVNDQDLAGTASDIDGVVRRFPLTYALAHLPADKQDLAGDEKFRSELDSYLKRQPEKKRQEKRESIRKQYEVDPAPLRLPPGTTVELRGEVESMKASFREMAEMLALAVLLVYLVMAAQFASWIDPFIMIVAAPLGLIGVAFMLWGTSTSLNIQSCMGVLMMVGISVSNSVLLVEFANRQRAQGMRTRDALISACSVRLRPILMTTIATLVGLAPMAIHLHPGDEMNLPLARAVIGGLAGSTLLTLFVVPLLYSLLKPKVARIGSAEARVQSAE